MKTYKPGDKVIMTAPRIAVLSDLAKGRPMAHRSAVLAGAEQFTWVDTGEIAHLAAVRPLYEALYIGPDGLVYGRITIYNRGRAALKELAK